MAIGAQNVWVLKRGVAGNHHIFTATICVLCDIILIFLGIFGAGSLLAANQKLLSFIAAGGALFLFWYGLLSLKSAVRSSTGMTIVGGERKEEHFNRRKVLLSTLAFTLLNPHVYLDTVVLLGGIGGQFKGMEKWMFAIGTMIASVIWFYGLASGANRLAPFLSRPKVRQGIDLLVCLLMWGIALTLLLKWFS